MNIKIDKEKIKRYLAFTMCGVVLGGELLVSKCESLNHSEKKCPITCIELSLGLDDKAINHQVTFATKDDGNNMAKYGVLKKAYINYDATYGSYKFDVNQANFNNVLKGCCYTVDENGDFVVTRLQLFREIIGTGVLSNGNYIQLRETKDSDMIVTGEKKDTVISSKNPITKYIMAIKYIGPIGSKRTDTLILEDRDGNKKEVFADLEDVSLDELKDLFKTYYYDDNVGYYKIDEDSFTEFMKTRMVDSKVYADISYFYEKGKSHEDVEVPNDWTKENERTYSKIMKVPAYDGFSFYYFNDYNQDSDLVYANSRIKKLVK